jgi:hypothetical protein
MSAALSLEPDEPPGSGLPGEQDADGWDGAQQGLYVTLPAEELTLEGFAEDGRADTMAPGPLLAMVLGAVAGEDGTGLAGLSDDQLIGFLSGTRRMESQMAWAKMAALAEFASRPRRQDFAADEVASAFNVTWLSAAGEIDYARTVKRRLPVTFAALGAGKLHPVHVKIIEETSGILSDEDAAIADAELAEAAQSKTYGELRRAATRLVLKLDPEAVRKRKEQARGDRAVVPGGVRQRRDHRPGDAERGGAGLDAECRGPCPCAARGRHPGHLGGAEGPRHPGPAARTRLTPRR